MKPLPRAIGTFHFVGIGGIGMSGIAEILHNLGYKVQGSDLSDNANVRRLRDLGIPVAIGHAAENLDGAKVVVISSAVRHTNPEVAAARSRLLPVVRRAEMLAELMRLKWAIAVGGTHGKTTTTSLIAHLLDTAGLDPTVINGGIINAYGTNARLGDSDWMVVEADESDGTFVKLPATVAVVTNIDPEHLDHYGDFDVLRAAFDSFVTNIPFYGFAALCIDHPEVQAMIARVSDRRIVTFGISPQADIRAVDISVSPEGATFDVILTDRASGSHHRLGPVTLPMHGHHNILNALGAIAVARELEVPDATMIRALATFAGVRRRFTQVGSVDDITVIDDYGHHPVEISAVLAAARGVTRNRVIAVFQPHRYSRIQDLFDEFCTAFNDADIVLVSDIYAAGESPIEGIHQEALVEGLRNHGHRDVRALGDPGDLAGMIDRLGRPGDVVVCLGAGTVTQWAAALPRELAALRGKSAEEDAG